MVQNDLLEGPFFVTSWKSSALELSYFVRNCTVIMISRTLGGRIDRRRDSATVARTEGDDGVWCESERLFHTCGSAASVFALCSLCQ
jgi:hypothetical protein